MTKRLPLLFVFLFVLPAVSAFAQTAGEECMDCGEKRTKTYNLEGVQQWPETSEALCCDFTCYGGFSVVEPNVGWGCATYDVNNALVVGTICKSQKTDQNCTGGTTGGGNTTFDQDGGGSTSCVRSNNYCPSWCQSCP